jgi:flagellar biogenesis protein FliO
MPEQQMPQKNLKKENAFKAKRWLCLKISVFFLLTFMSIFHYGLFRFVDSLFPTL